MDDLGHELDLCFHRGVQPDVYYRIPTSESLAGALQNELQRNASSLIPSEMVTEFVFEAVSTVTIPVNHQSSLGALIEPQDYPQSIQVEYALCRELDGKDRLGVQRAISKSIVAAIGEGDGFRYSERRAYNAKTGGDGARFKYVCLDSLENIYRKLNQKKKDTDTEEAEKTTGSEKDLTPTYDCGGAIQVRFSIKRNAINVVYKHNPIHRDVESRRSGDNDAVNPEANNTSTPKQSKTLNGTTKKRKRSVKDHHVAVDDGSHDPGLDMPTSPDSLKSSLKKKKKNRKSNGNLPAATTAAAATKSPAKKKAEAKSSSSQTKSRKKAAPEKRTAPEERTAPYKLATKACIRCNQRKIKCNKAEPSCNQCDRGLWTCQYKATKS